MTRLSSVAPVKNAFLSSHSLTPSQAVYVYMYLCGGQKSTSDTIYLSFETIFLILLEVTDRLAWLVNEPGKSTCLCLPQYCCCKSHTPKPYITRDFCGLTLGPHVYVASTQQTVNHLFRPSFHLLIRGPALLNQRPT